MDIGPDSRIGNLLVRHEIGRGAFGRVYLARDTLLQRDVALKVIAHGGDGRRAFGEAKLVAQLRSAHVVTLFGAHSLGDDGWAFELEYVDGGSLEALLGEPIPQDRAVAILRDVATGLKAAHDAGIVHGDVKPGNILLDRAGHAKIADFGLALPLLEESSSRAELFGTPRYMAPEVVMGARPSKASDIWSFGVLLWEVVGARYPFPTGNLQVLFQAVVNAEPIPFARPVPARIEELAFSCLRKSPAERPASCDVLLRELAGDSPPAPRPKPRRVAAAKLPGRAAELARVVAVLDGVGSGPSAGILVTGDAGIGKSRLLAAARSEAARRGFICLEVRASRPEGFLRSFLRVLQERGSGARVEPDLARGEIARELERRLGGLLESAPVALFVEDAQECSPLDARELRNLPLRFAANRLFVAATFRLHSETESDRRERDAVSPHDIAGHGQFEQEPLGPLSTDAILSILEAEAPGTRLGGAVAQRLTSFAEGNPLVAKELFRHLQEQNAVMRRDDEIVPGPAWGRARMPRRIRDLAARRLEGLTADDRAILDIAAVDGLEFDGQAIAAVLDRPLLHVLRALQHLYRTRGLVVPHANGFRFAHAAIHEAILGELAPQFRRELHARLAEELEGREGVDAERLGHHYLRAGKHARARPYLLEAALAAERRQEAHRVIELCEAAGLVPGRLDLETARTEQEVLFALAGCHHDVGEHQQAESFHDLLARAAEAAGDDALALRVAVRRAKATFLWKGRAHVDEPALRRAVEELPLSPELASACYASGLCAKYDGRLDEAEALFRRAGEVFHALRREAGRSDVRDQLGSIALRRGQLEEAQGHYAEAARISAGIGRRLNAAISEVNRSIIAFERGDLDGLADSLAASIRTLGLEGSTDSAAHAEVVLGLVRFAEGALPEARAIVGRARDTLQRSHFLPGLQVAELACAELSLVAGDMEAARSSIARAEEIGRDQGNRAALAQALALRALSLTIESSAAVAEENAREALRMADGFADRQARSTILGHVTHAVLLGLSGEVLDAVPIDAGWAPNADALVSAATSAARGELDGAASSLLRMDVGPRRELWRTLALYLRAQATSASGAAAAADVGLEAREAAAALGYRALQLRLGTGPG